MMKTVESEILAHAENEYPNESCGLVVEISSVPMYIACKNMAEDPLNYFEIDPEVYFRALQHKILAVVHSHPNFTHAMSIADRQMQIETDVPWWIVCEGKIYKYRNCEPLLGRTFKHGTTDCYTVMRDFLMLSGLELPNYERTDDWWWKGGNLYLDHLEEVGFDRTFDNPQIGDVILMQIQADVPNHVGMYIGNQQIIHHLPTRLSKRDLYAGYYLKSTHSIWRHKCSSQLDFTGALNDLALPLQSM